jgi:hypothetical protein
MLAVDVGDSVCMPYRLVVAYRPPSYNVSDSILLFAALTHLSTNCATTALAADKIAHPV